MLAELERGLKAEQIVADLLIRKCVYDEVSHRSSKRWDLLARRACSWDTVEVKDARAIGPVVEVRQSLWRPGPGDATGWTLTPDADQYAFLLDDDRLLLVRGREMRWIGDDMAKLEATMDRRGVPLTANHDASLKPGAYYPCGATFYQQECRGRIT